MSLRSRLNTLRSLPSGPPRFRYLTQHVHPDGRTLPTNAETAVAVADLEADGVRVIVMRTVYTQHSLGNGHGPAEWAA